MCKIPLKSRQQMFDVSLYWQLQHYRVTTPFCFPLMSKFLQGSSVLLECNEGLYFNKDLQLCDYPESADCVELPQKDH